jgi:hypothetical protein
MSDVSVVREPLTYERDAPHSFFRDLVRATPRFQDDAAAERIARHQVEMDVELRANPTTALSRGGEFAPPKWLVDHFAVAPAGGRVLADLIDQAGNLFPLPTGVSSINIPRFVAGASANIQTQQGGAESDADPTSGNAQGSGQVVTVAGGVNVSQQWFDLVPSPGADMVIARELNSNYNQNLEIQMLTGTGLNGQLLGLANVTGANTVAGGGGTTIATLWPLIGQVMAAVGNTRQQPGIHMLCAPRRWAFIASSVDSSNRPISSPGAGTPTPAQYPLAGGEMVSQVKPAGPINNLPVWQTAGCLVSKGTAVNTNTDVIYIVRPVDMELYESQPRLIIAPNPLSGTLQVRISLHRYVAFTPDRFPNGIGILSALPAPTNF